MGTQHNTHIANNTDGVIKVELTDTDNRNTTQIVEPNNYVCIPTSKGRLTVSVFRKHDAFRSEADDSGRFSSNQRVTISENEGKLTLKSRLDMSQTDPLNAAFIVSNVSQSIVRLVDGSEQHFIQPDASVRIPLPQLQVTLYVYTQQEKESSKFSSAATIVETNSYNKIYTIEDEEGEALLRTAATQVGELPKIVNYTSKKAKVELVNWAGEISKDILHPEASMPISLPIIQLAVYRKDGLGFRPPAENSFTDDSDRSFIIKEIEGQLMFVRSKYGSIWTEDTDRR